MPEESGDKARAPELMELGSDYVMDNYSRSSEEIRDITVDLGMEPTISEGEPCDIPVELETKLECDYTKESSGLRGEEACDITTEQGEIQADVMIGNTSQTSENSPIVSDVRKKGVAVIVGANHKFNVRSRYLSSPVGSCHDSCKFGHRHEHKTSPLSIRGTRRLTRMNTIDVSKSAFKEESKKKKFLRRLSLPGSIEERDDDGEETPKVIVSESKKEQNQSKLKQIQSELKPKPSSVVTPGQTSSTSKESKPRGNKVVVRNLNLLESSSLGIKAIRTKKEVGSRSKSDTEKGKEPVSSTFSPTLLKRSPSMKARLFKNIKSFSRSSSKLSKSEKANVNGSNEVPEKTLYMIEPQSDKKPAKRGSRFSTSKESSSKGSRGSKNSESKAEQKVKEPSEIVGEDQRETGSVNDKQTGPIMEDGGPKSNTPKPKSTVKGGRSKDSKPNSLRAKSNVQSGGPTKSNVEHGGSKPSTPKAKPTTVADGGSNAKPSTPRAKSRPSSSAQGPKSKGESGSKPSTPRPRSTSERRTKAASKGKASCPEENDSSAWKVKFRKGTVVALQAANSAPKKLLFRRAKVLDQANKTEGAVRVVKGKERRGNEPHDSKQPESREVRLRHQETTSKKGTIDLNNVIEETASQLVKTRKSKVKALVGAFETVMSLRDRKPNMVEAGAS